MIVNVSFTEKMTFEEMLEVDVGTMRILSTFLDMKRLKEKINHERWSARG